MASRALARVATGPADYERVYDRILMQAKQPVILHWLGDMFDPALAGYWGSGDVDSAMETALDVIAANPAKVDGIKISLLDKDKEIAMRRRLPEAGVRMYTGDDFNYAELIAATASAARRTSATATRCSASSTRSRLPRRRLRRLANDDRAGFHAILAPDRAAVAPHLQGADALLQDRRGVHGLSQRPPVALHHGRRPAKRPVARPPRRPVPPRRRGRPARRPGTGERAHAACAGGARHRY